MTPAPVSRLLAAVTSAAVAGATLVVLAATPVAAEPPARLHHDSGPAVHHDTSPALRDFSPARTPDPAKKKHFTHRNKRMPQQPAGPTDGTTVQDEMGVEAAPPTSANFDGVGNGFTGPQGTYTVNGVPPDPTVSVGPNHIVQMVNTSFAVFNKTGTVLYGPVGNNTIWSGFGGPCQTTNDGDPIVRYDTMADRWVLSQFANAASTSGPYYECVAVSQTSDPTGSYYRYAFSYTNFPDYPKLGVWPDAYYVTYNMFQGNTYRGAMACALDRSRMLSGLSATQQCFSTSTSYGGLLPADMDGSTTPPAGTPNVIVAIGTTSTTLATWRFTVNWTTPASSTFSGPTSLTVASYSRACGGGVCVPQSGTTSQLDTLGDRLMYRLAYRNRGGTQSYVVTHAVTSGTTVGVRWYELRLSGTTLSVFQQGTFAPDSTYRWMSSAAMDSAGNIGVGYSASSSSIKPAIRYTGRLASDPAGTLPQGEGTIIQGAGAQTGQNRWGDYSHLAVDPSDDCTFWYTNEYIPANGSFNWRTRIASFKFSACGSTTNDFSISVSPGSGSVVRGSSVNATVSTAVTSGSAQTVSLSASGLPSGASASFSPSSVTAGGSSTMTITTSSTTPTGTYSVTVTGTGTSVTRSTTYSLTVTASSCTAAQLLGNPGFESGNTVWSASSGVITSSTSRPARTGSWKAWLNGYGTTHTDTLSQAVNLPTGCTTYNFSFYVRIDTAETTTTTAYDTLRVQVLNSSGTVLSTLATYSNLNANSTYSPKSFNLATWAGQTVTLKFTGAEDSTLQTSFVIDDTAVNVS